MSESNHARAQQLIAQQRVEGISSGERAWLSAHLQECEACTALQQQTQMALSALRSMSIDLPKNLAARTQLRVRLRAEEMPSRNPVRFLLWAIAGVSWLLGLASAPLVWRGFEWAGTQLGLPRIVWQLGVAVWWLVPGIVATGAILLQKWSRADVTE
jgi:predicted anti-sigma-YlaC factor YlaD